MTHSMGHSSILHKINGNDCKDHSFDFRSIHQGDTDAQQLFQISLIATYVQDSTS